MALRHKPLPEITEADLKGLVANETREDREIEYKSQLPGNSPEQKREFLYDVSSFANSIGGDLVFGIQEDSGLPVAVTGVEVGDPDEEILRLDSLIRDGISPRMIPGATLHPVRVAGSRFAIIVRMARSLAYPHAVTLGGGFLFYSRNSAGKYRLDVSELRAAFIGAQDIFERTRRFRLERLAIIVANEGPIHLPGNTKLVLHIVPFRAFEPGSVYELSQLESVLGSFNSTRIWGGSIRMNFDGVLLSTKNPAGYVQVFRTGIVEAVDTYLLTPRKRDGDQLEILSVTYEEELIKACGGFLTVLRKLGVDPPLAVMLTLSGVKGYRMGVGGHVFDDPEILIDRDLLLVPEAILESYETDLGAALRPAFDAVWNAAGWRGSLNYDAEGRWVPRGGR